jgi:DNA-binding IscR family transcriptional regulator
MYGISRDHLVKVALKLWRLGYVTTLRGRAGGIALARRPEDFSLGEIVGRLKTTWRWWIASSKKSGCARFPQNAD